MLRRLTAAVAIVVSLAFAVPADAQYYDASGNLRTVRATATRSTIQASGAQTVGASSAAISVGTFREFLVLVNVTTVSGTTPSLAFFVDTSSDGGTTWMQIASGSAITATGFQLIPLGAGSSATPVLFGDTIRLRWTISGTTPSFTFSAVGIGK
jgi:hypothetical protein